MPEPRWLADEMLGRLVRYLRFVGHDTVYAHGWDEATVVGRARSEGRTLLTRSRALARKSRPSVLIRSTAISEQFREVVEAAPGALFEVRFDRCTLCNGRLSRLESVPVEAEALGVPAAVRASSSALYRCSACAHLYWEGSHTDRIRRSIEAWRSSGPRH